MLSAEGRAIPPRNFSLRRIPKSLTGIPVEKIPTDVGDLWMPTSDQVLRDYLSKNRTWESDIRALFLESMGNGKTFLDIGANVGYFSRLIAREYPACKVHAFEPHPITHAVLDLNTWEFGDQVQCWQVAIGEMPGVIGMRTEPNNLGDTHIVQADCVDLLVPLIPLDTLFPELSADVVKIDVQGGELSVLRGMLGVIRRSRKIKIVVEFWPARLREFGMPPETVLTAYRTMGFTVRYRRDAAWLTADDREILNFCAVSGANAQADLLLSKI